MRWCAESYGVQNGGRPRWNCGRRGRAWLPDAVLLQDEAVCCCNAFGTALKLDLEARLFRIYRCKS